MSSYHGWTHRPKSQGGTDPIGGLGLVVGEAYKETDQVISSGGVAKLTSWDEWNIEDPDVIDQATNGLYVVKAGYYHVSLTIVWSIGAATQLCAVLWGASGVPIDDITSPQIPGGVYNRCSDLHYIPDTTNLECYAFHASGANRTLGFAQLKVVRLHADPPVPYWA